MPNATDIVGPARYNTPVLQMRAFPYAAHPDPLKTLVTTGEVFESMMRQLEAASRIGFDFETTGLAWYRQARACGLALACEGDGGRIYSWYVPFRHDTNEAQLSLDVIGPAFQRLLANPYTLKIAHHIKFDEHIARREGWTVAGPRYCTMLAGHLFDENYNVGLKDRAVRDLGHKDAALWERILDRQVHRLAYQHGMKKEEYRSRYGYSHVPIALAGRYACFDTTYAMELYGFYEHHGISQRYSRIWATEMALTSVLCDMEEDGMLLDLEYLQALGKRLTQDMDVLEKQVWAEVGEGRRLFDLSNADELSHFMRTYLGLKLTEKTDSGTRYKVSADVLLSFAPQAPVLLPIMQWREAWKLKTTYTLESLAPYMDERGVLHTNFKQHGTKTGRLACENPNMQNIAGDDKERAKTEADKIDPWSVKRGFVVGQPKTVRVYMDYSQIELRVMAHYSRDPILVDAYLKGDDIHTRTAVEVFGSADDTIRRKAKIVNFGLSYGLTEVGFSKQAGVTLDEAKAFYSKFFATYQGITAFRDRFWQYVRNNRGYFENMYGRPRRVPEINSYKGWERGSAERRSFGSLIQGTAAQLTREALVRLRAWFHQRGIPAKLRNTVHDEIQFDVPVESFAEVVVGAKHLMEDFPEYSIPIVVDGKCSTTHWAATRPIPLH